MNVHIRPWQPEDAAALSAVANNKNLWDKMRDRFPHPYTISAAEDWIALCIKQTPTEHFCIEGDGRVCGGIGFIPGSDVEKKSAEIGYFVGEDFWGKGIATKAIALLVKYLAANHQFVRLFSIVYANNPGSMKALQKNGFNLEQIRKKAVFKNGVIMDDYVWTRFLA
jgi:[ribosomal protein S5]-alanine N-acetyltransferase